MWLVKFSSQQDLTGVFNLFASLSEAKVRKGIVVSSHHPRTVSGLYWGYSVRLASCLSKYLEVFFAFCCAEGALFHLGFHTNFRLHICNMLTC